MLIWRTDIVFVLMSPTFSPSCHLAVQWLVQKQCQPARGPGEKTHPELLHGADGGGRSVRLSHVHRWVYSSDIILGISSLSWRVFVPCEGRPCDIPHAGLAASHPERRSYSPEENSGGVRRTLLPLQTRADHARTSPRVSRHSPARSVTLPHETYKCTRDVFSMLILCRCSFLWEHRGAFSWRQTETSQAHLPGDDELPARYHWHCSL